MRFNFFLTCFFGHVHFSHLERPLVNRSAETMPQNYWFFSNSNLLKSPWLRLAVSGAPRDRVARLGRAAPPGLGESLLPSSARGVLGSLRLPLVLPSLNPR